MIDPNDIAPLCAQIIASCEHARAIQTRFLSERGLTWEQARALDTEAQAALQRDCDAWYVLNQSNRPLAAPGLTSYRARTQYGWTMIGAKNTADALREAQRSTERVVKLEDLQIWDGFSYVPIDTHQRAAL